MTFILFATYLTIAIFAKTKHASLQLPIESSPSQTNNTRTDSLKSEEQSTNKRPNNIPVANLMVPAQPDRKPINLHSIIPVPMTGQNQFAFDLYQAIRLQPGNLLYSPYSISTALAMAYVGAKGATEEQMAKTLHFPFPQKPNKPAVNIADLNLHNSSSNKNTNSFKLEVANSLWGQKDYQFRQEYLHTITKDFATTLQRVDFTSKADNQLAVSRINQWVSESTNGMIEEIISADAIDSNTRLILANAVYFKAAWEHEFELDPPDTEFKFTLLDNNTVSFARMSILEEFPYTEGEGYQAIELPYKGERMSMVIVLPQKGQFEEIDKKFNAQFIGQVLGGFLRPLRVALYMPKFKYAYELGLTKILAKMGMPNAFSEGQADFSGMDGTKELFINDIFHKAIIEVDETGTEAAAVTEITMSIGCGSPVNPAVSMRVNRPFLYFIRDRDTNTVLFVGRVLNPLAA